MTGEVIDLAARQADRKAARCEPPAPAQESYLLRLFERLDAGDRRFVIGAAEALAERRQSHGG